MIPFWLLAIVVFGVNFTVWGGIGLARLADERITRARSQRSHASGERNRLGLPSVMRASMTTTDVAVLMAAHNEEVVIEDSLAAIGRLISLRDIHVVSDGSTDRTVELARQFGVNVIETPTNMGKAGALDVGIRHFQLVEKYKVVLLLDADTRLDPQYFNAALPLFDDPKIVAVAGCAHTDWSAVGKSPIRTLLIAHRARVYALFQRLLKFGQTWSRANATYIVPGFASMYRTSVLPYIDINPPGLVIEDFNMTFEVYRKRLGKVGFSLDARAFTQDPDHFRDYVRQVKRWALGFWQTLRRHKLGWNLFSAMITLFVLELVTSSVMMLALPIVCAVLLVPDAIPEIRAWPVVGPVHDWTAAHTTVETVLLGVVAPDYVLTLAIAFVERRPLYLLVGVFLLPMRMIDAALGLYTLPRAWLERSTGRWVSPARRATEARPSDGPFEDHVLASSPH